MVGSVFFLLYSLSAVLGGVLADKFGTRIVIAGMVVLWSVVQFSTIFVSSFAFLLDYENYFRSGGRSFVFFSDDGSLQMAS